MHICTGFSGVDVYICINVGKLKFFLEGVTMISFKQKAVLFGLSVLGVMTTVWLLVYRQSPVKYADQLVVGTCSGFPPYEVLDNQGQLIGFDIDVASLLAQRMNKKLVFKDMSFDALVLAVKQGKIDMALAGISITKAKLKEVAMVHYQGEPFVSVPLLFWQHIPEGGATIYDLQKLANKTICVQAGNIEEEIMGHYDFLVLKQLEHISDVIMDIKYGKSIAACVDPDVAEALQHEIPELKMLNVPLAPEEQPLGQGICIAKPNIRLVAQVQTIIDQVKHDGTLVVLEKKWFKKGAAHVGA